MLITCPECSGKLSSLAPSCPHCGYLNKSSPPAAAAPRPAPSSEPLPELILPSDQAVRKAARRTWGEWVHSSVWRLFAGAVILLIALGLLVLVFLIALRLNDGPAHHSGLRPAASVGGA
jgi:hypothetical protein